MAPTYDEGNSTDYGNIHPISFLASMYKLFYGDISSRLMKVTVQERWISSEQKNFLPRVSGIQEHTHLLHAGIEEAKHKKRSLVIAWLGPSNAFGSIPHGVLGRLFQKEKIFDPSQIEIHRWFRSFLVKDREVCVIGYHYNSKHVVKFCQTEKVNEFIQSNGLSLIFDSDEIPFEIPVLSAGSKRKHSKTKFITTEIGVIDLKETLTKYGSVESFEWECVLMTRYMK